LAYVGHSGGFWEFDPLNVVGHCEDPKKALSCMIPRVLAIVRQKPPTGHFNRQAQEK